MHETMTEKDPEVLKQRRAEMDATQLRRRWEAVLADLDALLPEWGQQLRAARAVGERPRLDATMAIARDKLRALKRQRDAEGPPDFATGRGYPTPYKVALDRLGELWSSLGE